MNIFKIKTKDHPSNLDRSAVLVCDVDQRIGSRASVYRVSGNQFVAVLGSPYCLSGTFGTVAEARQAIEKYYSK